MTSHVSKWRKSACIRSVSNCKRLGSGKISAQVTSSSLLLIFTFHHFLHVWDCRSAVWPPWALMRCCVCTVPAMRGMLGRQMKRGMGLAQCTAAACFLSETEASCHSASSLYTTIIIIIITTQQGFWHFVFIPNCWHQFQSCSDSALLSNICFKRESLKLWTCSLSVM